MNDDKLMLFGYSLPARPVRAVGIDLGGRTSATEASGNKGRRGRRHFLV